MRHPKFKVGDKVKVAKKVDANNCSWLPKMDEYIGQIFVINFITSYGNFGFKNVRWVFPPQSLVHYFSKGQQLLFSFME